MIEIKPGVPFELAGKSHWAKLAPGGCVAVSLPDDPDRSILYRYGEYVAPGMQLIAPVPTDPFSDEIDPELIAVIVERSPLYIAAEAARDFVKKHDLHLDGGPTPLNAFFRRFGGLVIRPEGLADHDAVRFPDRIARIHGIGDITWFQEDGDTQVDERETLARLIAFYEHKYHRNWNGEYDPGRVDVKGCDLADHELTAYAAILLVPKDDAARAVDIPAAERIGESLLTDPALVQAAHQLWAELSTSEGGGRA